MARPKGSKNKTTVEEAAPAQPAVPFNYEEDDAKFDSNYQQRFQDAGYAMSMPASAGTFAPELVPINEANTFKTPNVEVSKLASKMFLVEGEVQLSSRVPGRGAMVAKQMRLVEAPNDDVALQKYVNYFNGLSDAHSVYTVISAAAMDTIR